MTAHQIQPQTCLPNGWEGLYAPTRPSLPASRRGIKPLPRAKGFQLIALIFGLLLLSGCQTKPPSAMDQPMVARFFMEVRPGTPGMAVQLPISRVVMNVNPKPVLVEYDIANVDFAKVDLGWCLYFEFTPAAARDLYRLSASNLGGRLVLMLNDAPAGARRLDQPIADGKLLIFVEVANEELPPIAERLKRTSAAIAKKNR